MRLPRLGAFTANEVIAEKFAILVSTPAVSSTTSFLAVMADLRPAALRDAFICIDTRHDQLLIPFPAGETREFFRKKVREFRDRSPGKLILAEFIIHADTPEQDIPGNQLVGKGTAYRTLAPGVPAWLLSRLTRQGSGDFGHIRSGIQSASQSSMRARRRISACP